MKIAKSAVEHLCNVIETQNKVIEALKTELNELTSPPGYLVTWLSKFIAALHKEDSYRTSCFLP
jgi:hypothetical protein